MNFDDLRGLQGRQLLKNQSKTNPISGYRLAQCLWGFNLVQAKETARMNRELIH